MPTEYTQATASLVFGDDDAVTDTYATAEFPMWSYREENGKGYRFVKFNNGTGNLTPAAGGVVYRYSTDGTFEVTTDVSDSDINLVDGILNSVPADGYYHWIQVSGPCTVTTNGDDDIAKGDAIIGGGDGTCNSVAQDTAPTNKVIGWALAADVDGANTVLVNLTLKGS